MSTFVLGGLRGFTATSDLVITCGAPALWPKMATIRLHSEHFMNNIPTYFVVVFEMHGESNSFLHPFFIILVVVAIAFLWPVELNAVRGLIHVHFTRLKVKCLFHHADQLNEEEPR